MFQICLQLTGVWGVQSSMAASEFGVHVSVCWCLHWAHSVCCITLTLEPPFHKQGELPLEGLSQCPEFLSGTLLFSPFSCRVAFEWLFQRGTRGLVQKKCPTHNPPPPPLPKPLHPTPSRSWHNSTLPQAPLPPTTSSCRLRQSRGWRAGRNGCWGSTVMGWCDLWQLFRWGGWIGVGGRGCVWQCRHREALFMTVLRAGLAGLDSNFERPPVVAWKFLHRVIAAWTLSIAQPAQLQEQTAAQKQTPVNGRRLGHTTNRHSCT